MIMRRSMTSGFASHASSPQPESVVGRRVENHAAFCTQAVVIDVLHAPLGWAPTR